MAYLKSGDDFNYTVNIMKLANVDNPTKFVKEQFQKAFKKNMDEIFKPIEKGGKYLSEAAIIKKLGTSDLNIIKSRINNINDNFYEFIKVE